MLDLYLITLVVSGVLLAFAIFLAYLIFGGFTSGAGYYPVGRKELEVMFQLSKPDQGKRVFDLGSGLGRIVLETASRYHARVTGVEVTGIKVWWTRREIRRRHLEQYADVVKANMFDVDVSSADIVYVFLWDGIMQRLKPKVLGEMKPGSIVCSYYHRFDGWEPEVQDKKRRVYVYRIPERR